MLSTVALALSGAETAAADPVGFWDGKHGPFAWEAKRSGCGAVGRTPSVIRAHTRWKASPANGYARIAFVRQVRDEATGAWATVQRQRRSTRNSELRGESGPIHWTAWFLPFADESGVSSRHIVLFDWLRDWPEDDRLLLHRERVFRPCVVAR
jgi:hypothetical protein